MSWKHYDLAAKWAHAGALVFGRRARVTASELEHLYQGHYENDSIAFSIAVWPLATARDGVVPTLLGSGDLYHHVEDGQDRHGKFTAYPLKELRREEAGFGDYFAYPNQSVTLDDEESRWFVVGCGARNHAVYYGVAIKPGQVPSPLPSELEALRASAPSGGPHPRTIVGVRLADTGSAGLAPFDPADARVAAAKRALTKLLPKSKDQGFLVVPCEARANTAEPTNATEARAVGSTPIESALLARLTERFGPLESDERTYFSGTMRGVLVRLDAPTSDVFDAWYGVPEHFSFNDRFARCRLWRGDGVTLAEVEIDTIDGDIATRWLGHLEDGERSLLLILHVCDERTGKDLLGIAVDAIAEPRETTLGRG